MANSLEDRVLKKNIPGKYTWWDDHHDDVRKEENDEENSNNDTSDDDDEKVPNNYNKNHTSNGRTTTRTTNRNNNGSKTGVKGVVADYQESMENQKYARELEQRMAQDALERLTLGQKLKPGELSMSAVATEQRKQVHKVSQQNHVDDDSDDDSFDDSDDEFFDAYRRQRILHLSEKNSSNWPVYDGELLDVTPIQFSDIIDDTDPRVWVIIHLYESYIPSCRLVNDHLRILAKTMNYCRFLCLRASSTKSKIDPVGLPSIMIYKGGDLKVNLTPVTQYLPQDSYQNTTYENFTVEEVKWIFESSGVIDPNKF